MTPSVRAIAAAFVFLGGCGVAAAQPGYEPPPPPTPGSKASLSQKKKVRAGRLGIRLELRVQPPKVKEVFAGTSAEALGIQVGDVVVAIDGTKTPTVRALVKAYVGKKRWAGDEIEVTVQRGDQTVELRGKLHAPAGLVGHKARSLGLRHWSHLAHLPKGLHAPLTLEQLKGRVVVLLAFLSTDATCERKALPAYAQLEEAFPDRSRVVFVYVHTVYTNFRMNDWHAGLSDLDSHGLQGPLAQDPGSPDGRHPTLMVRYRFRRAPWSLVIDGQGIVRYAAKTPSADELKAVIKKALGKKPKPDK